ncbi:MAG: hypothetical protein LUE86_05735 [Clostridiales bacterium]|nr:hypothetical protein [Clostridiales bacterium]
MGDKYIPELQEYRVGDIVKVKEDLEVGDFYDGCEFTNFMRYSRGRTATISWKDAKTNKYHLNTCGNDIYTSAMLELVQTYESTLPANEILEWIDWLKNYDFQADEKGLCTFFGTDCKNAEDILKQYTPVDIVRAIHYICGDVIYGNQFRKAWNRIMSADSSKEQKKIVARVKAEAEALVKSMKQCYTLAPLLDDNMEYCWYYVPDENSFAALKITFYDTDSVAFEQIENGFPKWLLAVSDGNGYGIVCSQEDLQSHLHRYLEKTEKQLSQSTPNTPEK